MLIMILESLLIPYSTKIISDFIVKVWVKARSATYKMGRAGHLVPLKKCQNGKKHYISTIATLFMPFQTILEGVKVPHPSHIIGDPLYPPQTLTMKSVLTYCGASYRKKSPESEKSLPSSLLWCIKLNNMFLDFFGFFCT